MEELDAADPRAVGEFRLRARLGSGGMGRVYLATSPAGRMLAIKVIHPELARDGDFVRRFRGEVAAARLVSGMYTAPVVAAGLDDSPPWLATAFVPGPALEDTITKRGPLPIPALWRLAAGLAEALLAIHTAGLVHRDLKPANVLLAIDGPRVIDFGISRALTDTRLTVTGMIIGTPGYMSPEQVEGADTGPPSDVFSLGSVLAFAASGTPPFSSPGLQSASILYRVVHTEPDLGSVPAEVRELLTDCLAKDPAQRPDLRQVAARCAAMAENHGLSPAAFWPSGVAYVIQVQQEALAAQIQALQVPSAPTRALSPDVTGPTDVAAPGMTFPPAPQGYPPVPKGYPPAPAANPAVAAAYPGTPLASPGSASPRNKAADVSRRRLLTGAGAAGVAVIGGLAGWALSSGSSPPAGAATGGTTGGTARTATGARNNGSNPTSGAASGADVAQQEALPTLPKYAHLAPGEKAWSFATNGSVNANATTSNGIAYVGSMDNHLYAVDISTGLVAWSHPAELVSAAPTVAAGIICAAGSLGDIYAFKAASGTLAWQAKTTPATLFQRTWAVAGRKVIIGTDMGALQVRDAATGAPGRTFTTSGIFNGTAAVAGDILYGLDLGGTVHAINMNTGTSLWETAVLQQGQHAGTGLVRDGDSLYLGAITGGTLYSLNAGTGRVNWAYQAGIGIASNPVIANGIVYFNDIRGLLHAITAADATRLWTYATESAGTLGPAVAGGQVFVVSGLSVQSIDARTGKPGWSFSLTGTTFFSSPTVADGLLFIGSQDNNIYAVRA
jgi:outer membrane protein assembly factor BamB